MRRARHATDANIGETTNRIFHTAHQISIDNDGFSSSSKPSPPPSPPHHHCDHTYIYIYIDSLRVITYTHSIAIDWCLPCVELVIFFLKVCVCMCVNGRLMGGTRGFADFTHFAHHLYHIHCRQSHTIKAHSYDASPLCVCVCVNMSMCMWFWLSLYLWILFRSISADWHPVDYVWQLQYSFHNEYLSGTIARSSIHNFELIFIFFLSTTWLYWTHVHNML